MKFNRIVLILMSLIIAILYASLSPAHADDHGDDFATATEISVGTVTTGTMDLPDDLDYFQFTVSQTGDYVIYSRNSIDIQAYLYDSSYSFIQGDDHSGEVDNFRIERTLNPGTYYLQVKADNSVDTGDYEIWLEGPGAPLVTDDHGYSWHSATEISVGTVTTGTMDLPDDLDYFQFTVSQTGDYVIYSRNSIDIQAYLYDSSYSFIQGDDHSGEVDNFRIERTLNPGTYYLQVKADNSVDTGDYEIWLEGPGAPLVTDDHGYSWHSATEISVGTVTTGTMDLPDDLDYFQFTVSQTGDYVIYSRNSIDIQAYLYDSSYSFIQGDDHSGEVDNFRIERTLNPGTYYLQVKADNSVDTGDYEIWLEGPGAPLVTDDHGYSWHSATEISVGTVTTGTMDLPDDLDYFQFTVSQTGDYVIYSRNSIDIQAYLYDSSYSFIQGDDHSGEVDNFRIERTLNPGTYYLQVKADNSVDTGDYEIWLEGPGAPLVTDDHGYSWHSATEISVGTVTTGTMDLPDDLDYFQFTVSQTGDYVIYSRNSIDIQAYLYDSSYSFIQGDDHSGEVDNFRIERTLNPGTYYLQVKADNSVDTGDYKIWLEDPDSPIVPDSSFTVRMSNVDDLSTLYINGLELYMAKWGYSGTELDWQYVGHQPGDSGVIDITSHLISGKNALRFTLWNEQICCSASLTIEIKKNGQTLFYDSFDIQDSSSGIKYDETFIINNGPSISQTPMTGPPGTTFIQSGAGFTLNNTVTLHFRNHLGDELPSLQFDTDAIGTFEVVYDSPTDKPEGTHTWWAVDDASSARSQTLAYAIVVNAGQTTPIIEGQTQILPPASSEKKFGELIPHAGNYNFKPDEDTFVIVHGWNRSESTIIPGWMALMGAAIANDSPAQGSNVYYWNWMKESKTLEEFPKIPYQKVEDSGKSLAEQLNEIISPYPNYEGDIHFIGFSLGSGVIVHAAKYIYEIINEDPLKQNLNHLVMLDSPWYVRRPGGSFLRDHENDFFIENYYSALGRPTGYWEADTNVYLHKSPSALFAIDIYGDPHGYSHEWYRSSVTNFSDIDILGDLAPPPTTIPYGFYWWNKNNQNSAFAGYIQEVIAPHWFLRPFLNYIASGIIVDTAYYTGEIATETWDELNEFAERSGKKIKLLSVNTFNSVSDTAGYVKDELAHAFHEAFSCTGIICGGLRLENHSESIVTTEVQIPALANWMIFGFDFHYASPGTVVEVFIEDEFLYFAYSHDEVGKGYQMTPWIDISQYAGDLKQLTFRISNTATGTEGAVRIDDLIFARIENQLYGDHDEDCDVDGADLAEFVSIYSGEGLDNFAFSFGKDCL